MGSSGVFSWRRSTRKDGVKSKSALMWKSYPTSLPVWCAMGTVVRLPAGMGKPHYCILVPPSLASHMQECSTTRKRPRRKNQSRVRVLLAAAHHSHQIRRAHLLSNASNRDVGTRWLVHDNSQLGLILKILVSSLFCLYCIYSHALPGRPFSSP